MQEKLENKNAPSEKTFKEHLNSLPCSTLEINVDQKGFDFVVKLKIRTPIKFLKFTSLIFFKGCKKTICKNGTTIVRQRCEG